MDTTSNRNLTAFFDEHEDAARAIAQLKVLGLTDSNIRLTGGEDYADRPATDYQEKGFWDSISNFFFPDEDRVAYAEGLRRGGYLVTVSGVPESVYDDAVDILDDEGSVDLDERTSEWKSEGWDANAMSSASAAAGSAAAATGVSAYSSPDMLGAEGTRATERTTMRSEMRSDSLSTMDTSTATTPAPRTGIATGDDEVISVLEEQLRVGKRDVNMGRVRVRSYIVEEPVSEAVTLREDRVEIERRPVDRALTGEEVPFQDRVIEAEEYKEEVVISKEARVKEEIALRRTTEEHTETVSDTVRHTEVEVEDDRTVSRVDSDRLRTDRTGLAQDGNDRMDPDRKV